MTILDLASTTSGSNLSVQWYYIVGIVGGVSAIIFGVWRWYKNQITSAEESGKHAQTQAQALTSNTEAAKANTLAISVLTDELRGFANEVRTRFREIDTTLNGHDKRLDKLERLDALKSNEVRHD